MRSLLSEKTKEIEENNEYLTSMVEAIPDLIFIYDKESRYLDFHAYQQKLLYFKPKEFIGKTPYQIYDEELANEIYLAIQKTLSSSEIVESSYFLDFKEGRRYFESRYKAINSEKVLAVVRDITENKLSAQKLEKSEQKYRNLVSQASDVIFLSDEKGRLLELNKKGVEMTGISTEDIGEYNLTNMIAFKNDKRESLLEIIHQHGAAFEEANLISLSNKTIPIEINCKLTPQKQIQGIIRDITARNNFVKSIQQQNEKLKEIAWIQSHEVRAPLARLLGLLDYFEKFDNLNQSDKIRMLNSIRESALELDLIIRDVVKRTELDEKSTS
jgi:PAS domain S-box-containing protein